MARIKFEFEVSEAEADLIFLALNDYKAKALADALDAADEPTREWLCNYSKIIEGVIKRMSNQRIPR